jgi:hypothetical protein
VEIVSQAIRTNDKRGRGVSQTWLYDKERGCGRRGKRVFSSYGCYFWLGFPDFCAPDLAVAVVTPSHIWSHLVTLLCQVGGRERGSSTDDDDGAQLSIVPDNRNSNEHFARTDDGDPGHSISAVRRLSWLLSSPHK